MHSIEIEGIRVQVRIGFVPWEQEVRQEVLIDLNLSVDLTPALEDDSVTVVDYKQVTRDVIAHAEARSWRLAETLADTTASLVLQQHKVSKVDVRVTKVGALRNAKRVSVRIVRTSKE